MKFIENGLLYDIDKAKLLHVNRLQYLYITPNKRLFLIDEEGGGIITNQDDLKNRLGHINPEKYIELFGQPEDA